jgi:hypothetical protein
MGGRLILTLVARVRVVVVVKSRRKCFKMSVRWIRVWFRCITRAQYQLAVLHLTLCCEWMLCNYTICM